MKYLITYMLMVMAPLLLAQPPSPGGIAGCILWAKAQVNPSGAATLAGKLNSRDTIFPQAVRQACAELNYHPALLLRGTSVLQIQTGDLSKMTLICIFFPLDTTSEQLLWYTARDAYPSIIATTARTADLENSQSMNFQAKQKGKATISTYVKYSLEETGNVLVIGAPPPLSALPLSPFQGLLAEVILYDRVLAPEELLQIESYLAIKYGIPLDSGTRLTRWKSASGADLLVQKAEQLYKTHTFAIGRDDATDLYQRQSKSAEAANLLSVGLGSIAPNNWSNTSTLEDGSFIFFSDNGKTLELASKKGDTIQLLQRSWMVKTVGNTDSLHFALQFNTRATPLRLKPDESWCLAVDRSGEGSFSPENTAYYPVEKLSSDHVAFFSKIRFDDKDVFTFCIRSAGSKDPERKTDGIRFVELYPNPASGGQFQVMIALEAETAVEVHVRDPLGRLIHTRRMHGNTYYTASIEIPVPPGTYTVQVIAGQHTRTLLVIVL